MEKYIKLETVSKEGIKHELKMKRIDENFLIDYIVKINEVYNKLIDKVNEQDQIIREAREYVKRYRKIYDIDGSIEPKLDEFNILASPKRLLEILDRNVK